jgi:hypothetical protein
MPNSQFLTQEERITEYSKNSQMENEKAKPKQMRNVRVRDVIKVKASNNKKTLFIPINNKAILTEWNSWETGARENGVKYTITRINR